MDGITPGERLLTIGELSRLSRISIRMLRHYDDHGVLPPTSVDERSGRRSYATDLLTTARRLRELRDVGLGVDELAACAPLLARPDGADALRALLQRQRGRLAEEAAGLTGRMRRLDALVTELARPSDAADAVDAVDEVEIIHRTLPATVTASLRDVIPAYRDEGVLWGRLMAGLPATGAVVRPKPPVAVFHDEGFVERGPDVEVRLEVVEAFADHGEVRCAVVPAQDVAVGVLRGDYDGTGVVTEAIGHWAGANGYRFTGPMFTVYLVGPAQDPDPRSWVTEVCAPVASGAALRTP